MPPLSSQGLNGKLYLHVATKSTPTLLFLDLFDMMNLLVISPHLFNTFCVKILKMFAMTEDTLTCNS